MAIGDIRAGRAYVEIVARDKLNDTLKGIEGTFRRFATGLVGGFAAVGSAAALVGPQIVMATDELGAIADAANRIGASAANLIGLQRAAQLGGASAEVLVDAMDKLQKRLASGEIDKRLDAIGLSAKDLKALTLDEAVLRIADAVRNLSTEGAQAAAMYDLFGRSGQQLTVTLKQGSEELRRQIDEARALGLVVEGETLDAVETLGDSWDDAKLAASGFWRQLTGALAPALQVTADLATEAITDGAVLSRTFNAEAIAAEQAAAAQRQLAKDRQAAAAAAAAARRATQGDDDLRRNIAQSNAAANDPRQEWRRESIDALQEFTSRLNHEIATLGESARAVELYRLSKQALSSTEVEEARALAMKLDALEQEKRAREDAARARALEREQLAQDAAALIDATRTPEERFQAEVDRVSELFTEKLIDPETFSRALAAAREELRRASGEDDLLRRRGSGAAGTFNPFAVDALGGNDALTKAAQETVRLLERLVGQAVPFVVQP